MKWLLCFLLLFVHVMPVKAEDELDLQAESAYLIEAESGLVLYEKKAEEKLYPASMTKMMGLLLIYEALHKNQITLQDEVTVSENAASMGGSQVYLEAGETMNVSDLLKAICISSANDAMVAMAEKISGSVLEFVKSMNEKGKQLGLVNTNFANTTGLHDPNHYSCAKDMAIIGNALIREGQDELLAITSTYDAYIRESTDNPFWLVNTNKMIRSVEGVDGLKTGFTQESKSCITVSAKRNDIRLIGVIMKATDSKARNQQAAQLLDYGFGLIDKQIFFLKSEPFMEFSYELGKPSHANLIYMSDVSAIIYKNKPAIIQDNTWKMTVLEPPWNAHEKIGEVTFKLDNNTEITVDLALDITVQALTYFDMLLFSFQKILT